MQWEKLHEACMTFLQITVMKNDGQNFLNSYLKALGSVSKQTGAEGVLTLEKLQLKGKIYDGAHRPSVYGRWDVTASPP